MTSYMRESYVTRKILPIYSSVKVKATTLRLRAEPRFQSLLRRMNLPE